MSLHSKATLYVAGVFNGSKGLAAEVSRFGFKGCTILAGLGAWEGIEEPVYTVTIVGETASAAHIVHAENNRPVLMPGMVDAFAISIRNLAENLAREYKQQCVAFDIVPCLFELTTAQAAYVRNGE